MNLTRNETFFYSAQFICRQNVDPCPVNTASPGLPPWTGAPKYQQQGLLSFKTLKKKKADLHLMQRVDKSWREPVCYQY